jgi:glutaconate CoA-transferase subunit A
MWGITGIQKEAVLAARRSLVTVEEIVPELDERPGGMVLPTWAVSYVATAPGGSHPSYTHGYSERDNDFYVRWDAVSRNRETFRDWMEENVLTAKAAV